jgi:hypothetical protein
MFIMAVPWLRILDTVIGVGDLAMSKRAKRPPAADDNQQLAPGLGGLGQLETRLTGVVVAALKEAFDRDSRRLDLEHEQVNAERLRAERAMRLELLRQAGDRELGRLRLTAVMAVASWIGTLFFSARLIAGGAGARLALGSAWVVLLAALALAFAGQAGVGTALARVDLDRDNTVPTTLAATLAPWFVVAGLALVGMAVLISGTP